MSRADDGLDELPVVELAVGDVGRVAAAAGRLGDGARLRAALVGRGAMLATRPMAAFTPYIFKGGPPGAVRAAVLASAARRLCVPPGPRASTRRSRVSAPLNN